MSEDFPKAKRKPPNDIPKARVTKMERKIVPPKHVSPMTKSIGSVHPLVTNSISNAYRLKVLLVIKPKPDPFVL